jgi:prepilin-type processing-associated H-X9-DG protein
MMEARRRAGAFTLLELVVVAGVIGLLCLTMLPAFCRSNGQTKVTACAANLRQWTVSVNVYAKDNRDWLPRFDVSGGGMYGWDAGTNLGNALAPYGLTLPTWFCPVRPNEEDTANAWAIANLGHPIQTIHDLMTYLSRSYPGEIILNYNWWVPRAQGTTLFPTDYSSRPLPIQPVWIRGTDPALYGWPARLDDRASARVPFLSDKCASGASGGLNSPAAGTSVANISPNTAHFFNGVLDGVNAAFVDGHVETRKPAEIRCVSASGSSGPYWFY